MGETRILSNGARMDTTTGRIIGNPPGGPTTAITSTAQAVALARSRWDAKRAEFEHGLSKAMQAAGQLPPGDNHPAAAWRVIGELSGQWLLDATTARDYSQLLHEVRSTVQDREEAAASGATIHLGSDVIAQLLAAIQDRRAHDQEQQQAAEEGE